LCHECHEEYLSDDEDEVLNFVQLLRRVGIPIPIIVGRPPVIREIS